MSATAAAHVDVLTAEVRTLMVGRRQVTMSVYRQLDWIRHDLIEPFGRVNDGDRWSSSIERIATVGRNPESGSLCRASFSRWYPDLSNRKRPVYLDDAEVQKPGDYVARYREIVCTRADWRAAEELPLIVLAGLR